MSDELVDPDLIPVPPVDLAGLEAAAAALTKDGRRIGRLGHEADAAWQGLAGPYRTPEARLVLGATRTVASHGRAIEDELATVGKALQHFVDTVRPVVAKLHGLRAGARDFRAEVDGDWDGDFAAWRDNGAWVKENNRLNNAVWAAVDEYKDAERACVNKITALFGGAHLVPSDAVFKRRGDVGYGWGDAPRDLKSPWGAPAEHDKPWYQDVWDAGAELVVGTVRFFGDLSGLHGQDGWLDRQEAGKSAWGPAGAWWNNISDNYPRGLKGLGNELRALTGQRGDASDAWKELGHSIIPWREWDDRPGYVATHSILSLLSLYYGGKSLSKFGRGSKGIAAGESGLFPDKGLAEKLGRPAGMGDLNTANLGTLDRLNVGDLARALADVAPPAPLATAAVPTLGSSQPPHLSEPHTDLPGPAAHDPTTAKPSTEPTGGDPAASGTAQHPRADRTGPVENSATGPARAAVSPTGPRGSASGTESPPQTTGAGHGPDHPAAGAAASGGATGAGEAAATASAELPHGAAATHQPIGPPIEPGAGTGPVPAGDRSAGGSGRPGATGNNAPGGLDATSPASLRDSGGHTPRQPAQQGPRPSSTSTNGGTEATSPTPSDTPTAPVPPDAAEAAEAAGDAGAVSTAGRDPSIPHANEPAPNASGGGSLKPGAGKDRAPGIGEDRAVPSEPAGARPLDPRFPGPLGDGFRPGVVHDPDMGNFLDKFDPFEEAIAQTRASEGRHVAHAQNHERPFRATALERTGPSDPGTPAVYEMAHHLVDLPKDAIGAMSRALERGLDRLDENLHDLGRYPDGTRPRGVLVVDGRNVGLTEGEAVTALKNRVGPTRAAADKRFDTLGGIQTYLADGTRIDYHDGHITHIDARGEHSVPWDETGHPTPAEPVPAPDPTTPTVDPVAEPVERPTGPSSSTDPAGAESGSHDAPPDPERNHAHENGVHREHDPWSGIKTVIDALQDMPTDYDWIRMRKHALEAIGNRVTEIFASPDRMPYIDFREPPIDPRAAFEFAQELESLAKKYPSIAGKFRGIATTPPGNFSVTEEDFMVTHLHENGDFGIFVNSREFIDYDAAQRSLFEMTKRKHLAPNGSNFRAILAHEWAHGMWLQVCDDPWKVKVFNAVTSNALRNPYDYRLEHNPDEIPILQSVSSGYGGSKVSEFPPELFAEYRHSKSPRLAARVVGGTFDFFFGINSKDIQFFTR